MERQRTDMTARIREKVSNRRGMTMAEMLITVAIIVILAGVAFLSVISYQRMLAQLERDKVAKDIYFAAQNHLTAARGEGYLKLEDSTDAAVIGQHKDGENDVYYFVYSPASTAALTSSSSILNMMLPFGSLDDTVRTSGSYVVRYNKAVGLVMDVFYCTKEGTKFGYNLLGDVTYDSLISADTSSGFYGNDNKKRRRTEFKGGDSILGWYGGEADSLGDPEELKAPSIVVNNAEKLTVEVTDNNTTTNYYSIRLILTGVTSGAQKGLVLKLSGTTETLDSSGRVTGPTNDKYTIVLDDITSDSLHFGQIDADTTEDFIPGEDVKIQAVTYSLSGLATIEYSDEKTTNSLYASTGDNLNGTSSGTDEKPDTAYISNFRHLENLDRRISNLDENDTDNDIVIGSAIQTADLSWSGFLTVVGTTSSVTYSNDTASATRSTTSSYNPVNATTAGCYKPVILNESFNYDGDMHSVTGIKVRETKSDTVSGNAGMFSSTVGGEVRNLDLIDFDIQSVGSSAGALVGSLSGTKVQNVVVRNTDNSDTSLAKKISNGTGAGTSGGLIGTMSGGSLYYCAAAVTVGGSSTTTAGGLVGAASGSTAVTGCYSGGHTKNGSYLEWIYTDGDKTKAKVTNHDYDVIGTTAGGLIGSAGNTTMASSYSTCSVSGTTAGGLAGSASGSISKSYATGLIDEKTGTGNKRYAFVADGSPSFADNSNNYYLNIINEVTDEDETSIQYLDPVSGGDVNYKIEPFDETAKSYEDFIPDSDKWKDAVLYDKKIDNNNPGLETYYGGEYNLKAIPQLVGSDAPTTNTPYTAWTQLYVNAHYGDWPAPEVFIVNS